MLEVERTSEPERRSARRALRVADWEPPRWRGDIQGLRGLAVGLVVLVHAFPQLLPGGFIGVDVFFVLSGYLITSMVLSRLSRHGRVGMLDFYARRARRILPAACFVLCATMAASLILFGPGLGAETAEAAIWASLFISNEYFVQASYDYFAAEQGPSAVQQFWSLAVEEQFYLVWPWVLALAVAAAGATYSAQASPHLSVRSYRRHGKAWLVSLAVTLVGASFAWSVWLSYSNPAQGYFSSASRAWEIAAGCMLAMVAGKIPSLSRRLSLALQLAGVALVMAAAVLYDSQTRFPGVAALVPVLGTLLVLGAGTQSDGHKGVLSAKALVFLGGISFSLYLWHWPVLTLLRSRYSWLEGHVPTLCLVALSISLAYVTTRFLEDPVRNSPMLRARPGLSLLLGAALIVIPVAIGSVISGQSPSRAPSETTSAAAINQIGPLPSSSTVSESNSGASPSDLIEEAVRTAALGGRLPLSAVSEPPIDVLSYDGGPARTEECQSGPRTDNVTTCVFGDPRGVRSALLIGDSHATMWVAPLDAWARSEGFKLTVATKTGCTPSDVVVYSDLFEAPFENCHAWRERVLDLVDSSLPNVLILAERVTGNMLAAEDGSRVEDSAATTTALKEGLSRTLQRVGDNAGSVIVLGDVPAFSNRWQTCLHANPDDVSACSVVPDWDSYMNRLEGQRVAARQYGAFFVDTLPWFCHEGRCPAAVDGKFAYRDGGGHITATYAYWLLPALAESLAKALTSEEA